MILHFGRVLFFHLLIAFSSPLELLPSLILSKDFILKPLACQDNAGTSSTAENQGRNELTSLSTEEASPDKPTKVKIKSSSLSVRVNKTVVPVNAKRLNGNFDIIQEEPMDAEHDDKFMGRKPNKIPNKDKISSKGKRKQETPKRAESVRRISHGGTDSSDDETQDYILPEEMDQGATQSLSPTF